MRHITGVQIHHSVNLEDASRFAANMLTALEATLVKCDSPEVRAILEDAGPIVKRIGAERTAAGFRLQMHAADPDFRRYRDGELPWPDEREDNFVPRCTCNDRCLFHDTERGTINDCNCSQTCGQHDASG